MRCVVSLQIPLITDWLQGLHSMDFNFNWNKKKSCLKIILAVSDLLDYKTIFNIFWQVLSNLKH